MLYDMADGNATFWLNTIFQTSGSVKTAQCSPDLIPCNFYLWDWMKQLVYGNQLCPESVEDLQQRVEVVAVIVHGTPGTFLRFFTYRLKGGSRVVHRGFSTFNLVFLYVHTTTRSSCVAVDCMGLRLNFSYTSRRNW